MKAGRELDARIAIEVIGFNKRVVSKIDGLPYAEVPHYSTRIQDAWLVAEKMVSLEPVWVGDSHRWFTIDAPYVDCDVWYAGFRYSIDYEGEGWDIEAKADTAPLAICLAALKAVE